MNVLAPALLMSAAVALLLTPVRLPAPPSRQLARRLVVVAAPLALLAVPGHWLAPALVLSGSGLAGWLLWRRRRERVVRAEVARRVLGVCEDLAGDLAAGQPPAAALARAARGWPDVAPAAEAFRVGADVPTALRGLATRPGAADLRLLAAAWQVAHRTGQGLADAVDRVARQLVADRATRRLVEGELASARATARLVAVLPVAALAMGSGVGGDPVAFLFGTGVGVVCLALGLAAGLVGLWWIEAIAADVDRGG
jgi:tight adherence protein B